MSLLNASKSILARPILRPSLSEWDNVSKIDTFNFSINKFASSQIPSIFITTIVSPDLSEKSIQRLSAFVVAGSRLSWIS